MRRARIVALHLASLGLTALTPFAAALALVGVYGPIAWLVVQGMRVGDAIRAAEG